MTCDFLFFFHSDLLSSKLIHLCEFACGRSVSHSVVQDEIVSVPFEKDGDLIQLELTVDFLLNSAKTLPAYSSPEVVQTTRDIELPNIYPIKHTITLEKENFYEIRDIFRKYCHSNYSIHHQFSYLLYLSVNFVFQIYFVKY